MPRPVTKIQHYRGHMLPKEKFREYLESLEFPLGTDSQTCSEIAHRVQNHVKARISQGGYSITDDEMTFVYGYEQKKD